MKHNAGIWESIKKYRLNSVFVKNFVLIMLLVIMPLSFISIFIYRYFNGVTEDEIKSINKASLIKVKDTIDTIIKECDNICLRIITDNYARLYILSSENSLEESILPNPVDYLNYMTRSFTLTNDYIDSIYIFSENKKYVISNRGSAYLPYFFDNSWYTGYSTKKTGHPFWMDIRKTQISSVSGTYFYLSLFRVDDEKAGAVIMNIDLKKLGRIIDNKVNKDYEDIFIVDKNGMIIYNKDERLINSYFKDNPGINKILSEKYNGSIIVDSKGVKRIISAVPSDINGWRYISYISLMNYEEKIKNLNNFITIFICISILIAVIVSILISIKVFGPIRDVISAVERPEEWLQFKSDRAQKRYDEIKFISSNIADNYLSIHELKSNLEKRIILLKKAQTVALQSQINPHFLYNTLETINWMAMELMKGKNMVSNMILSLSQLLRLSLDTESSLIPIFSEIDHVKMYTEIQKYRYGEKFDVLWEINEDILQYKIVKITIQPLIENAIYHGIKPKEGKGTIRIKGYTCDEDIVIEVIDDGIGIGSKIVDELNIDLQNEFLQFDSHIGLKNVNQRIKLIMGDRYGLSVNSGVNGTIVRILISKVD